MKRSDAIRMIEANLRLVLMDPGQPRRDGIPMNGQQMREQIAAWLVGLPMLRKELKEHGEGV